MENNYEAEKAYFAKKKPVKITAKAKKEAEAAKQEAINKGRAVGASASSFDKLSDNSKIASIKKANKNIPVTTTPADILVSGERKLPAQSDTRRTETAKARSWNDYSTTRSDLPAGLRQSAHPQQRSRFSRKDLDEIAQARLEGISNRANRVSGPSLPPPFKQHRHVEEVLMLARRAAKSTYTDASELAGARGVLNHAANNLEDAGQHHAHGNYGAAHSSLLVAAHSLEHAVGRIDAAHGGNAPWGTTVHPSEALKNHLNSYRDEYL